MINKFQNSELIKILESLRKELASKTKEMNSLMDPQVHRLTEINCQTIRNQIANLESKIQPEVPKPVDLQKAQIEESIHKCDEKIAGFKQINESSQREIELEQAHHKLITELSKNEYHEVADEDIPVVPISLKKPAHVQSLINTPQNSSKVPTSLTRPDIPIPMPPKPTKYEIPKDAQAIAERSIKFYEPAKKTPSLESLVSEKSESLSSLRPAVDELKEILQVENEYTDSEKEIEVNPKPMEKSEDDKVQVEVHIENDVDRSEESSDTLSEKEDKRINKIEIEPTHNATPLLGDRIQKIFRDSHYQIFRFQPQNPALKTLLAHFDFLALKTSTNVPFYKDLYMDLLFVKIISGPDPLILDRNIEAVQFERSPENKLGTLPSSKNTVLEPLAAYLSMQSAFKQMFSTPSDENSAVFALAKLLNLEFVGTEWVYRQKYAHISMKFLTITEVPVKFKNQSISAERKYFAGFPEVQALFLSEMELVRFMEYTQAKYNALFAYNRKNVQAKMPQPVTIQFLKYKMLYNAIVGGILVASSIIVMTTSDPNVYWGLLIGIGGLVGGLYLAIKLWEFRQRQQVHTQFIHHSCAAFNPEETRELLDRVSSESFKTALAEELRGNARVKTGFQNKLHKLETMAHKSVSPIKKQLPSTALAKVQVLNKNQLIQDFLSE